MCFPNFKLFNHVNMYIVWLMYEWCMYRSAIKNSSVTKHVTKWNKIIYLSVFYFKSMVNWEFMWDLHFFLNPRHHTWMTF